jgi:hypothetical protein
MLTRKQQWRKTQSSKVISQRGRSISNLSQNDDSLSSVLGAGAILSSVSEFPKKLRSALSVISFLSYADKLERPKVIISLVAVALIYFTFLIALELFSINRIRDR